MKTDYLVVGSGLSGLVFGALMAKSGKLVQILEAHEFPGGFGHTFNMGGKHKFNAQLHYVWNCGEGQTVNKVLKQLGLDKNITFERYDPNGFDHMKMPGYSLEIPSDSQELIARLSALFPQDSKKFESFIETVQKTSAGLNLLSSSISPSNLLKHFGDTSTTLRYLKCTLQDVFDKFKLPQEAQTLLALQWPDFLLPPNQLSFYAWVMLFTGYQGGAFYPNKHFEHVIDSLVQVIESNGGEILFNHEVTDFNYHEGRITGVKYIELTTQKKGEYSADNTICNMDPQKASEMIGLNEFSKSLRKKLNYDYSPSNFMAYCTVKGLDLRDYGFGKWNVFHTSHLNLNEAFVEMYERHDFSKLSFAITTPSLMTDDQSDRPEGQQIMEFLTVANYDYFKQLKETDEKAYKKKKKEILDVMIDTVERHYIPNFRQHIAFKITGSPTTNERFCWSPKGNSYGSNMTPYNIGIGRLNHNSSIKNFYFCNASSGYAGFAGTFWTGANLYQELSGVSLV